MADVTLTVRFHAAVSPFWSDIGSGEVVARLPQFHLGRDTEELLLVMYRAPVVRATRTGVWLDASGLPDRLTRKRKEIWVAADSHRWSKSEGAALESAYIRNVHHAENLARTALRAKAAGELLQQVLGETEDGAPERDECGYWDTSHG